MQYAHSFHGHCSLLIESQEEGAYHSGAALECRQGHPTVWYAQVHCTFIHTSYLNLPLNLPLFSFISFPLKVVPTAPTRSMLPSTSSSSLSWQGRRGLPASWPRGWRAWEHSPTATAEPLSPETSASTTWTPR